MQALLCLALIGISGNGQGVPPTVSRTVQTNVRSRVDLGYNPGIVIGIVNAEGRTFYSYGQTSLEDGRVPDENTLYEIGSITKVFTGTLLAEMVERGDVALNDPVESILPEGFDVPKRDRVEITLKHLSTHTSGLPANPPLDNADPLNPFAHFTEELIRDFLRGYSLTRRPGAEWEYSNLGVGLLGDALGNRLGTTYEEALQMRILGPLGLQDTVFSPSEMQAARLATGYFGVVSRPPFKMGSLVGAGELKSTVNDLLTFLEYQLAIRPTGLSSVLQNTRQTHFSNSSVQMGLGWIIVTGGTNRLIFHDGATLGQNSFIGINLTTNTGVVVLTNARLNQYSSVSDIGFHVLVPSSPLSSIPRPADVPLETLRDYFGRYVAEDGASFQVGVLHDRLTVTHSEAPSAEYSLYPVSDRRFLLYDATGEASADFTLAANNLPTSMVWTQLGQPTTFNKETIPPRLYITSSGNDVELTLTGDTNTDYLIESSEDLIEWTSVTTSTIWDEPIIDSKSEEQLQRFYRARVDQ